MRCFLSMLMSFGVVSACTFDTSAIGNNSDDAGPIDASPVARVDARPPPDAWQSCVSGSKSCSGDTIQTCKNDGTGADPDVAVDCDFACVEDNGAPKCVEASNVDGAAALCKGNYKSLVVGESGTATFSTPSPLGLELIECVGCTSPLILPILESPLNNNQVVFCLSEFRVASSANVEFHDYSGRQVVLIVEGVVDVQGEFNFSGKGRREGPGGGSGGALSGGTGDDGEGLCFGEGGATDEGMNNPYVGGGGGGAGNGDRGGRGRHGHGYADAGNDVDYGERGSGGNSCSKPKLVPLIAGSGGGSGGDGSCGGACGWAGGGGGGAIQISSKISITIGGTFEASGGDGGDDVSQSNGGGGGGGSGGGILLEAPSIMIGGRLKVEGGNGGDGKNPDRAGGVGGREGEDKGMEGDDLANGDTAGGVGGGGGGGRIRLNSFPPINCSTLDISPSAACSAGEMLTP